MKDAIQRLQHNDYRLKKCIKNVTFRMMLLKERQTILDTLHIEINKEIMQVNKELKLF